MDLFACCVLPLLGNFIATPCAFHICLRIDHTTGVENINKQSVLDTVKPFTTKYSLTLKLPGPYVGMGGSLTVTVA